MRAKLKNLTKITALALVPALAGVWAISHLHRSALRAPAALARGEAMPQTLEQMTSLAGAYRLEAGKRYVYHFDRKILISGFSKEIPEIAYGGEFYLDVLDRDSSGFSARVSEKLDSGVVAPEVAIQIHVEGLGRKLELQVPDLKTDAERQHANLLKDLLSQWLFPLDRDTVGSYQAQYDPARESGDVWALKKRKIAYLGSRADSPKPEIVFSEHLLEWREVEGIPRHIQGKEATRLGSGSGMSLSSESSYTILFSRSEISKLARGTALAKSTFDGHEDSLELSPEAGGRASDGAPSAWASLLSRIDGAALLSRKEQLALFGDLVHELRGFPDSVAKLTALLSPAVLQAGPQSPLFKLAVGALATAGTPEAQSALLAAYNDPSCPTGGKGTILAALTTTQAPLEASTREFLLNASQSEPDSGLATGAAFALGSALQNAPSDEITQKAIAAIQNSTSDERVLLDVIGNSGRPEFLPILTGVIASDADSALRSKAVYSLRFMQVSQAAVLLGSGLSDPDPGVRLAAASAIQLAPWSPSFSAPLQSCASSEPVAAVQSACQIALHRSPASI